jgi:hypothetical protein
MSEEKVIDISAYLYYRRPSMKKYGIPIQCPECSATDYWKAYSLEIDEKVSITAFSCCSDECTGNVFFVLKDGIVT